METTIERLKEEVQQVLTTNILPYWIEKMQDRGNGGLIRIGYIGQVMLLYVIISYKYFGME